MLNYKQLVNLSLLLVVESLILSQWNDLSFQNQIYKLIVMVVLRHEEILFETILSSNLCEQHHYL